MGRVWRVAATGFCFIMFGLGGLVLRFVAFPLLALLVRSAAARRRAARRLMQGLMNFFVWLMTVLGTSTSEVRGRERLLPRGQLILANHPSLIDVVFLMAVMQNTDCVVKAALFRNPFTRGPVTMAGYLCNNGGPGLVSDAIDTVRAGGNLLLFPEGTRSVLQGALRMQRGAANIAVRGRLNIRPVVVHCSAPFLGKGMKWWQAPQRRPHFIFDVREEIAIAPFLANGASDTIASRHLTRHLHDYYTASLQPMAESHS